MKEMKILKGLTAAVGALSVLYLLVGKLIEGTELSYRFWVDGAGLAVTLLLLPFLLIFLGWMAYHRRGPKVWEQVLLAIGLTVVYLCWFLWALVFMMFSIHEERRLVGDLLLANEADFLRENVWVYYRQKGIFFRVPGEFTDEDAKQYLEEKYGSAFQGLQREEDGVKLFQDEACPELVAGVYRDGWELADNYVEARTALALEDGCRALALERELLVEKENQRWGPHFYLVLENEADIGAFSEDAGRLLEYVNAQTDFYKDHRGVLYFLYMEGEERITGGIPFGKLGMYDKQEKEYWLEPEKIAETVRERYESGMEQLIWRQEYEAALEVEDQKSNGISGQGSGGLGSEDGKGQMGEHQEKAEEIDKESGQESEILDPLEESARLIYEVLPQGEDYSFQVCYNAKGNFYVDLGSRPAGLPQDVYTEGTYRFTLVYDRTSRNGKCELFVFYKEHYAPTADSGSGSGLGYNDSTAILEFYAVETDTGKVIAAGKTAWDQVGSEEYREVTGE